MTKVIYTAIFGKYDDLKEPFVVTEGWRYVCFTDQDFKSDVWEIVKAPVMSCGPSKTARYYKIMFHRHIQTEFSMWVDGTFIINTDLDQWWRQFKAPFTAVQHPFDTCIYKEASSCLNSGKGEQPLLEKQINHYKSIGVPSKNGLIASGILMRQTTELVSNICELWWREVEKWSSRDQIAFGYVSYKYPFVVNRIEWNYTNRSEFIHIPHLGKEWRVEKLKQAFEQYGRLHST